MESIFRHHPWHGEGWEEEEEEVEQEVEHLEQKKGQQSRIERKKEICWVEKEKTSRKFSSVITSFCSAFPGQS